MWKFVSRGIRETLERRANCRTNVYSQTQDGGAVQCEVNPSQTPDKHDLPNSRHFNMCRGVRAAEPITGKSRGFKWNPKYSWTEAVEWSGLLAVGWVICQSLCLHRRFFGPDPEAPWRKRISQAHNVRISNLFCDLICIKPKHILPITNCVGTQNDEKGESGGADLSWSLQNSQKPYGPITIEEALKDAGNEFTKVHRIVMGEYEFQMGSKALEEKRYKEAVKHFSTGASLSSSASMFNLALCYELGLGTFVDLKEAAKRYRAAADSGHADAMYNLGVYHAQGKGGLKVNLQIARELFTKAARLGQPEARHALSLEKPSRQTVNDRETTRCAPIDKTQGSGAVRMDSQVGAAGILATESSKVADSEVHEPTGLSPLASSLDHNLTIQEDMGIENTWAEANSSDYAIPMPPPPGLDDFADVGADPVGDSVEYGPFLPPGTPALNNLFAESGENQDDSVIEVTTPPGVCGLRNLGNTCFMAAGLQCLTATPPVLRHFLDSELRCEKPAHPRSLMAHFGSLLDKMWSGRYSVVRPAEFKQTLGTYHPQFKDYRQHDCQEFLALLLDSLHEQMNTAKSFKNHQIPATTTTGELNGLHDPLTNCVPPDTTTSSTAVSNAESYENLPSPECPNSSNVTVAGSPRDSDSPMGETDSAVNSPRGSLLNDDEETLDSDEIIETRSSFIHNKMQEDTENETAISEGDFRLDKLDNVLSKKVTCYHGLCDILKDAKTSNANFLVTQEESNNEIRYDSQKYPKENIRRTAIENSNLTENHDFDNKSVSIKRIKEVNVQAGNRGVDCLSSGSDLECDSGLEKCNVKRMRLEDQEKNHRRDGLGSSGIQCSRHLLNSENGAVATQGENEAEADRHWAKHLRANRSVIVDTFQGQFKSTVVCAVCKHISVTYEPFMYLSVPLPRAMERQLAVTYIPANGEAPTRCVVSLNKQSRIGKLKEELLQTLGKNIATSNIALAEVLENHIARILDDNSLLKYVNDTTRSIYAFELSDPPNAYTSVSDGGGDRVTETEECRTGNSNSDEIGPCTICLEELDGDLKKHRGNGCNFVMCDQCIENFFKSPTDSQTCPVCSTFVTAASFTKIDQTGRPRPAIRNLNVPLVLRRDSDEGTNNRKGTKLYGYPHLVKLPSRVNAKDLYNVVKKVVPQEAPYSVHFVDGQGHHCSRCMYTAHCTGCRVPDSGMVALQNGDTLAVRYTDTVPQIIHPVDHISVSKQRPHRPLSLYDCLQAFSQSETLDEHNPWFCPKCEHNQCATKTLTVHRYPKFLIVYLKRFVFYECVSMKLDDKVTFPLVGLGIGRHLYDLYACVCHFGGVSAGHYTAYARNPKTDTWHYYNDELTTRQKPQEEDFSNAYILFYSRQGTTTGKPCNI